MLWKRDAVSSPHQRLQALGRGGDASDSQRPILGVAVWHVVGW